MLNTQYYFYLQAFSLTVTLTIMSMTFDRFLAIRYPFKAITWCTPRWARITVAASFIFSMIYCIPFLFTSGLINKHVCVSIKSAGLLPQVYSWVNTCFNSVVPFSSLLTMNVFIIRSIRKRGKYLTESSAEHNIELGKHSLPRLFILN